MGISPRRSGRSAAAPHPSQSTQSPPSPRKRRNSLQSYNQSPPPREEQPLTSPALDDDDEEDEEDDGSAEITRCVCGSQDYPFPDADVEDTGFMICCERCNVWQHGPCVGVMSENEAPDVYFCEECRPDLHELGSRNQGYPLPPVCSVSLACSLLVLMWQTPSVTLDRQLHTPTTIATEKVIRFSNPRLAQRRSISIASTLRQRYLDVENGTQTIS